MSSELADRMRRAADTIEAFNKRYPEVQPDAPWRPSDLRKHAEHVEAQDREFGLMAKELAGELYRTIGGSMSEGEWRKRARKLIDAGWRKVKDSE